MTFDCEKKLALHLIEKHGFAWSSDPDEPWTVIRNGTKVDVLDCVFKRLSVERILRTVRQRTTNSVA